MGIRWSNGEGGFGVVARMLHWLVVLAIAAQFVVGYALDAGESGRGRGRGRGGESGRGRGRGGGFDLDDGLLRLHVAIGVLIVVLAVIRLVWRLCTTLPPWPPGLSSFERRLAHWTERLLYVLMFAVPLSGLWLIVMDDDDALVVHVAAHVAFFVALAAHVGLVLKHQLIDRDHFLRRML